jgi:hypothetical protein
LATGQIMADRGKYVTREDGKRISLGSNRMCERQYRGEKTDNEDYRRLQKKETKGMGE